MRTGIDVARQGLAKEKLGEALPVEVDDELPLLEVRRIRTVTVRVAGFMS